MVFSTIDLQVFDAYFVFNYQIIEVICAIQASLQSFQEKYHQSQ